MRGFIRTTHGLSSCVVCVGGGNLCCSNEDAKGGELCKKTRAKSESGCNNVT